MERPTPRLIRTPDDAEIVAAEWLRHYGFADVVARPGSGADGGIDLAGSGVVGQVKTTTAPAGRPVVQQTFGIATAKSCKAVIFSLSGFSDEAVEWANLVGVSLFEFDLQGQPMALNNAARAITGSNPVGVRNLERLADEILAQTKVVLKETSEVDEAAASVRSKLPPGMEFSGGLVTALSDYPAYMGDVGRVRDLITALEVQTAETEDATEATNRWNVLSAEFDAELERLGLTSGSASANTRALSAQYIKSVNELRSLLTSVF